MGRHQIPRTKGRLAPPVLIALLVVPVLLLAGGLVWWLVPGEEPGCQDRHRVAVTVAPELESVAREVLADPIEVDSRACAVAEVIAQEPLRTVGDLRAL